MIKKWADFQIFRDFGKEDILLFPIDKNGWFYGNFATINCNS